MGGGWGGVGGGVGGRCGDGDGVGGWETRTYLGYRASNTFARDLRGESSPDILTQRLVGSKTLDFHTSSMDFQWIFTGQFWEVRACLIRPTCGG